MTELSLQPGGLPVNVQAESAAVPSRVSPARIEALVLSLVVHTTRVPGTTTTLATAVLPDGFAVGIGHSGCIDPATFNAEIGVTIATERALKAAREKLWELEGYLLRDRLAQAAPAGLGTVAATAV